MSDDIIRALHEEAHIQGEGIPLHAMSKGAKVYWRSRLWVTLSEIGIPEVPREKRLTWLSRMVGHIINSSYDLTGPEIVAISIVASLYDLQEFYNEI